MPASLKVQATRMPRFEAICDLIARGKSTNQALEVVGVPWQTFTKWLRKAPEADTMVAMLTRVREVQMGSSLDEVIPIADASTKDTVNVDRLRCDARLKLAPLMAPRVFGKAAQAQDVTVNVAVQLNFGSILPGGEAETLEAEARIEAEPGEVEQEEGDPAEE